MNSKPPKISQVHYRSFGRQIWLRLKRNRVTLFGLVVVLLYCLAALAPGVFTTYEPNKVNPRSSLQSPSAEHIFGTDEYGRDVFTRVLYGARLSLSIGLLAVIIGLAIGGSIGIVTAYYGGLVDTIFMRLMDILLAIPGIMLAIALVAVLGSGIKNVIIAIGIYNIPSFARIARSTALAIREEKYITAARMIGVSNYKIIVRHLLPNSIGPLLVYGVLRFGHAILLGAGLSFLGLGVQPPTAEWGAMLASSRNYIRTAPYLAFAYGLSLSLLVLGFNAAGEGLRDVLDPSSVR
jgi:peptide/nickel transport system permease protein